MTPGSEESERVWSFRCEAKLSIGARASGFLFTPRMMEPRWSKDCSARAGRRRSAAKASSASRAVMRLAWRPPPMAFGESSVCLSDNANVSTSARGYNARAALLFVRDR